AHSCSRADTCAEKLLWTFWSPRRGSKSLPHLLWAVSKPTGQAARIRRRWPQIWRWGLRFQKRYPPRKITSREQSKNHCAGKRPMLSNISPHLRIPDPEKDFNHRGQREHRGIRRRGLRLQDERNDVTRWRKSGAI